MRFDLVAHLLLLCMIWAALTLNSPVADQQGLELGKLREVGESHVWCWMNKLPGGHKGQVKQWPEAQSFCGSGACEQM